VKRFLRENSLGLVFGLLFLIVLVGQAFAGHADFNQQQLSEGLEPISLGRYLTSASFGVDVLENWQSEYLQFFLYIFFTVWLLQKGSPESKELDKPGRETDQEQKIGPYADDSSPKWARAHGFKLWLFSNSLGLVMGLLFVLSWLGQSIAGVAAFNEQQLGDLEDPVSWPQYLTEPLAVASMAILAIYLRQRGSSQSKPVGSAHTTTGIEG
jgi:hypothetical protein